MKNYIKHANNAKCKKINEKQMWHKKNTFNKSYKTIN